MPHAAHFFAGCWLLLLCVLLLLLRAASHT